MVLRRRWAQALGAAARSRPRRGAHLGLPAHPAARGGEFFEPTGESLWIAAQR